MLEHREVEIVHRAFQLNPAMPKGEVRDHHDALMAKYGLSDSQATAMQQQMERTAADEGLEFHLVGGVTGNTFDAHRLVHLGRERGIQDAVIERLFRAHFTEQRSIFDEASLVELAAEAGLDADGRARDAGRGRVRRRGHRRGAGGARARHLGRSVLRPRPPLRHFRRPAD